MSGRIGRIIVPFCATSDRDATAVAARLAAHAKAQLHVSFSRTRICCRSSQQLYGYFAATEGNRFFHPHAIDAGASQSRDLKVDLCRERSATGIVF